MSKNLNIALSRMSAIGAVSLLVPGPKMIWQFGELGWEYSILPVIMVQSTPPLMLLLEIVS
jgi:hypothetical protein